MKIQLLFPLILILAFSMCKEAPTVLPLDIDTTVFDEANTNAVAKTMTSTVSNTSNQTRTISWYLDNQQFIEEWSYTVVINDIPQIGVLGEFELRGQESVDTNSPAI